MKGEQFMKYWINSSDADFEVMLSMYASKHYHWSLFVGHLALEKLFKALYAKSHPQKPDAPFIHNLIILAQKCNIQLDDDMFDKLTVINTFNIATRYADAKNDFYARCTKEYAQEQINNIKEIREWLKEKLTQEQ